MFAKSSEAKSGAGSVSTDNTRDLIPAARTASPRVTSKFGQDVFASPTRKPGLSPNPEHHSRR
jgi:hypothetical protein